MCSGDEILHSGLEERLILSLLSHGAVTHLTQFHVFIIHIPACENKKPNPTQRKVFDPGGRGLPSYGLIIR